METGKEWNLTFIPLGSSVSKIINKTLFFCLSISVINTTDTFALKMECPDELKCAATGRPG